MSVFVTREQPTSRWIAGCCDERCGFGMHTLADTETKAHAEAAATRHRKLLRAMPPAPDQHPRSGDCPACGQRAAAVEELLDLVAELEARLARAEAGR
ncbi:hypothetical protein [Streptomyces youssoufiensis]